MKFLLVGLGNIGNEYAHTRHNIGFDIVNAFVAKYGGAWAVSRLAYTCTVSFKGKKIVCICPTTYMNLSGRAVKYWMDAEKIPINQMLVVVDDLALPLGKLRIRGTGSDAGHNGLKSIKDSLQSIDYPRLRFGIGNDFPTGMQAAFVLSKWKKIEEPLVNQSIPLAIEAIEMFLSTGLQSTMTFYNK